jgi:lipid II:glycine glycyltransferase (peptidoglycan interpeptide bridge formation enzyme)
LDRSEEELLASFHKTARQNIRAPGKKGLVVRSVTNPSAAERLEALLAESFQRTRATAPRLGWHELIRHASESGAKAHIAGLFREDQAGDSDPLSFAVAYLHGDVAEYAHAGSVRDSSLKVSLLYSVAWELMRWAKQRGATGWDFGGVTEASPNGSSDDRAGITSFKRYFSDRTIEVGEEWVLAPIGGPLPLLRSALRRWPDPT